MLYRHMYFRNRNIDEKGEGKQYTGHNTFGIKMECVEDTQQSFRHFLPYSVSYDAIFPHEKTVEASQWKGAL